MKKLITLLMATGLFAVALPGCDDDDGGDDVEDMAVPDMGAEEPFARLNFVVDDTANMTYAAADGLAWKGSFSVSDGMLMHDPGWGGPFAVLYDDGPWDAGGHEPAGATAGDHIWGISIQTPSPEMDTAFEYGLIRGSVDGSDGQWIWVGPNGQFTLPAGSTETIDVYTFEIPAFGEIDMRLTLDTSMLHMDFAEFDPANGVAVKSSAWGWSEIALVDDGTMGDETADDGVFTFVLSNHVGAGSANPHTGLLNSGDQAQFVFVLGGVEYKTGGAPPTDGVAASTMAPGGDWMSVAVSNFEEGDRNTYITAP